MAIRWRGGADRTARHHPRRSRLSLKRVFCPVEHPVVFFIIVSFWLFDWARAWKLLLPEEIGVRLTKNHTTDPEASLHASVLASRVHVLQHQRRNVKRIQPEEKLFLRQHFTHPIVREFSSANQRDGFIQRDVLFVFFVDYGDFDRNSGG